MTAALTPPTHAGLPRVHQEWTFPAAPTPAARLQAVEDVWAYSKARHFWPGGFEQFLPLHSFYHFHTQVVLSPAQARNLDPPHWELALFYEAVIALLPWRHTPVRDVPPELLSQFKRLVYAPRGTYKSTMARSLMLWLLLHDPTLRILYGKAVYDKAARVIWKLGHFFEHNAWLQRHMPEYTVGARDPETGRAAPKPRPWGKFGLLLPDAAGLNQRIAVEATITPSGLDRGETGEHYDLFVADDYVTRENYTSPITNQKTVEVWREQLSVMGPLGLWVVCGTPWPQDRAYPWLEGIEDGQKVRASRVLVYRQGASSEIGATGTAAYPTMLPLHVLRSIREDVTISIYASLYDCQPMSAGNATFRMSDTRYYRLADLEQQGERLAFHCFLDPAATTKLDSDKTGIALVAIDHHTPPHVYLIEVQEQRYTYPDVMQLMVELYRYWRGHPLCASLRFWMTSVVFENAWRVLIETYVRPQCPGFMIDTLERNTRVPKHEEIATLRAPHERGELLFRLRDDVTPDDAARNNPEQMYPLLPEHIQIVFREMRDHVRAKGHQTDDALDALAQVMKVLRIGAAMQPDAPTTAPTTRAGRESVRRHKQHTERADFEHRYAMGEFEGMSQWEAVAAYKEDYLDQTFEHAEAVTLI